MQPAIPEKLSVNLAEVFEMLKSDIVLNHPSLAVFTFHVANLNGLFDQLIFASLDHIIGYENYRGYDSAMDILIRNGLEMQAANKLIMDNVQRLLVSIQNKFPYPITNSGIRYRPARIRFNHLELIKET